ncbi:WhiB family transcriptional regulator [Streptomyces sp. NPDC001935]
MPFPHSDSPTPCQKDPAMFAFEEVTDQAERDRVLVRAKLACSRCPVVRGCLLWTLANPSLTRRGVWAATTSGKRAELRRRMVQRLGEDWVGVVAERNRRRTSRQHERRTVPPTLRQQMFARLEAELIPVRPDPYEPWREPMTSQRQAHNRYVLELGLADKTR